MAICPVLKLKGKIIDFFFNQDKSPRTFDLQAFSVIQ